MRFRRVCATLSAAVLAASGPAQAAEAVDVALVLAADVSRSINEQEFGLQRRGYAAAITSSRLFDAIRAGTHGAIAIAFVEAVCPVQDRRQQPGIERIEAWQLRLGRVRHRSRNELRKVGIGDKRPRLVEDHNRRLARTPRPVPSFPSRKSATHPQPIFQSHSSHYPVSAETPRKRMVCAFRHHQGRAGVDRRAVGDDETC